MGFTRAVVYVKAPFPLAAIEAIARLLGHKHTFDLLDVHGTLAVKMRSKLQAAQCPFENQRLWPRRILR